MGVLPGVYSPQSLVFHRALKGNDRIPTGQIITTSAEVTLNGGLIRELPQNPLNSGLGIIVICPDSNHPISGGEKVTVRFREDSFSRCKILSQENFQMDLPK